MPNPFKVRGFPGRPSSAAGPWAGKYLVRIAGKPGYKAINHTYFSQRLASGGTYTGKVFAERKMA